MDDRDLDLAFRALREGIVGPEQIRETLAECLREPDQAVSTFLVARGWATPSQIAEIERDRDVATAARVGAGQDTEHDGATATVTEIRETEVEAGPGVTLPFGGAGDGSTVGPIGRGPGSGGGGGPRDGGRYRRERVHGVGGLGRVWLAHDTYLGRDVALKEIRDDRSSNPDLIVRFLDEARITGQLEHPGIVALHDLVERDEATGLPFYTMRFLAGRTFNSAIEAFHGRMKPGEPPDPLERRGLLDAFRAVCQSVAFAHSRGVVHRDLKGQNVILGDFGEVFVIDWGLAKAPQGGESGPDLIAKIPGETPGRSETEPGSILGTPGYIAPELLDGVSAGARSDIYSLGAILYLLLAGRVPYAERSRSSMLKALREAEPIRPRTLAPDAPEPLEAICLMAMSRDPAGRYGSASELAEEVRRWQADEPVAAYRDPPAVRLARWARKHRSAVVTTSGVMASALLCLAIATPLLLLEQGRTAEQKTRAEAALARAEVNLKLARQVDFDLLKIANERLSPIPGTESARVEIFESSPKTFEKGLGENPDDPDLNMWAAQTARFLANLRRTLSENPAASASYLRSIDLLEKLVARAPQDVFYKAELALALGDYGQSLARVGRLREGAATIRRSVEVAEALAASSGGRTEPRRTLAASLNGLASVEGQLGRPAESARLNRKAVALYDGLLKLPGAPLSPIDPLMMGSTLFGLATAEREGGHPTEALAAIEEGLSWTRRSLAVAPADNNVAHNLNRFLFERARVVSGPGGPPGDPEKDLDLAILGWDKLAERHRLLSFYRSSAAEARRVRGALRAAQGRDDLALQDLEDSREALEKLSGESPDVLSYRSSLGRTSVELGRLARKRGDAAAARDWFGRAVEALAGVSSTMPENARDRRSLEEARAESARAAP